MPAPSMPDAAQPRREPSWPAALVALVVLSALVVVLCVLGATMSGLFGFLATSDESAQTAPNLAGPTARTAATRVEDGLWLVGLDLIPGTYATTVPAESPGCAWERNDSTDGMAISVLESGVGRPGDRLVVGVKPTDQVFQSSGCGLWQRIAD